MTTIPLDDIAHKLGRAVEEDPAQGIYRVQS